jgi:hypothetical protein
MDLPEPARAVCDAWLAEMDRTAPGLVTGLHVRGGIGFGEFVLGKSDVDFVAVLCRRPTMADEDLIEAAHGATNAQHPEVPFDGLHLLAEDLAADPEDCPDVPCVLHGYFEPAARYDLSPVAWHELAGHSVTVRGELPEVWTDQERLLAFTRDHLDTDWRRNAEALAKFPAEAETEHSCEWCVLGVARLHHLLVTGEMTAKSAAGRWGLGFYDERFHRVLREALRIRDGIGDGANIRGEYADPAERGRDTAEFTAYVVNSSEQDA